MINTFHLKPVSSMRADSFAAVTRCAALTLERRGYIEIERDLFGEHIRYVLTSKGRTAFTLEEGMV